MRKDRFVIVGDLKTDLLFKMRLSKVDSFIEEYERPQDLYVEVE